MMMGVVWKGWRAHGEGAVDAGTHEVSTRKRLPTLACRKGEGCGRVVDCSHRAVGSVGDVGNTTTLGVRASWRTLARFGTLESWRGLSRVMAFVSWRAQCERSNVGCRWAMAVADLRIPHMVACRRTA